MIKQKDIRYYLARYPVLYGRISESGSKKLQNIQFWFNQQDIWLSGKITIRYIPISHTQTHHSFLCCRFYVFVCNLCNGSFGEFVHRLDVRWVDVVHLAIFNLTLHDVKTYFDYDQAITRWIHNNWELLQAPLEVFIFIYLMILFI